MQTNIPFTKNYPSRKINRLQCRNLLNYAGMESKNAENSRNGL